MYNPVFHIIYYHKLFSGNLSVKYYYYTQGILSCNTGNINIIKNMDLLIICLHKVHNTCYIISNIDH